MQVMRHPGPGVLQMLIPVQSMFEVNAGDEECLWEKLPEQCKEIILGQLSLEHLARIARTCRDFAQHIRTIRSSKRHLAVPASEALQPQVRLSFLIPISAFRKRKCFQRHGTPFMPSRLHTHPGFQ